MKRNSASEVLECDVTPVVLISFAVTLLIRFKDKGCLSYKTVVYCQLYDRIAFTNLPLLSSDKRDCANNTAMNCTSFVLSVPSIHALC